MRSGDKVRHKIDDRKGVLIEMLITERGRETWLVSGSDGKKYIWPEADLGLYK